MLCVLFKQWLVSVQAWRSRGKEVAACLHSWIVLWAPQCLMHFCSNIHKCADDPHWCWCSQLCLHPLPLLSVWMCVCEQSNSETLIATTFFPTVGVCCFNLEAWTIDKKYYKAQFITLRHKGTAVRRDTDRWRRLIALTEVLSNKEPDIDIRRSRQANCCLNYLLWSDDKSLMLLPPERKMYPGIGVIFASV